MKQVKWGILSTGTIAHTFAKTLNAMNDGQAILTAVASRNEATARSFAEEYGIKTAHSSYEAMAADPEVDIIYIATPHNMHYENMRLCLENGKHVLCEKTFTITKKEAEDIFALAKSKGLFVMEAFWTKFMPLHREVEKILRDGTIGKVNALTAQYGYCTKGDRAVRKFDPSLGGGALFDIGVYNIGFACMMLGYYPKDILSSAIMSEAGTDENSAIIMRYENGAMAQLTTALQTQFPMLGCIYGTKGRIVIPEFKNPTKIEVFLQDGGYFTKEHAIEFTGFEYQIREAGSCVLAGKQQSDIMTAEQSIAVMDIMDRVRAIWGMKFPFEA